MEEKSWVQRSGLLQGLKQVSVILLGRSGLVSQPELLLNY